MTFSSLLITLSIYCSCVHSLLYIFPYSAIHNGHLKLSKLSKSLFKFSLSLLTLNINMCMINISLRQIHHLNSHVPTPGLSLGIFNLTKPFKICSLYIHELTHHIYIPAQIDAYIVKGIFFYLISLRLSFQIKSVPITSE